MNIRAILYFIGHILRIEAALMLPGAVISFFQGERAAVIAFVITMAALLVIGQILVLQRPKKREIFAREGFVTVALGWIFMSLFGALPFFLSGSIPSFLDAWFETVSGFTTTGATILTNVEAMPMGLLYWRSFTHWIGGMGVLVFMLAIVPMSRGSGDSLYLLRAESPGPVIGKLVPQMRRTTRILYAIYIALTVIEIGFLLLGGMPLFDAVTHAFGTAGTGGFSIKNASLAAYSPYLQSVVGIFMMLFGVNFGIYYLLLVRDFKSVLKSEELRVYLGIMAAATLIVTLNIRGFYPNFGEALHHGFFQVSSIMTTTGYTTADFALWPELSRILLLVLMIIGASAGSTGGGMKVSRFIILWKVLKNDMQKMLHPHSVKVMKMDGHALDTGTVHSVNSFLVAYAAITGLSMLFIALDNFSTDTTISSVLACLNNIGPGLGTAGPTGNFSTFSPLSKLVLSADMLIGRLEIFPILMLFSPTVWKKGA